MSKRRLAPVIYRVTNVVEYTLNEQADPKARLELHEADVLIYDAVGNVHAGFTRIMWAPDEKDRYPLIWSGPVLE